MWSYFKSAAYTLKSPVRESGKINTKIFLSLGKLIHLQSYDLRGSGVKKAIGIPNSVIVMYKNAFEFFNES